MLCVVEGVKGLPLIVVVVIVEVDGIAGGIEFPAIGVVAAGLFIDKTIAFVRIKGVP